MSVLKKMKEPKFGKEYYLIKGGNQYPMFLAVALGMKRSFDEWVDSSRYDEFVAACKVHGLHVEPDVIFTPSDVDRNQVIGGNNVTTTYFVGNRFIRPFQPGEVHVYVARTKEDALYAKKFGWYSVVIDGRSTNKPFVDHLRFGIALGFPECCVDFFRRYNNWALFSHPLETLKNTPRIPGKARGSYYCNNILMDQTYFYIHHLPCSYRCETTIGYARELERRIMKHEPAFADMIKTALTKPFLVLGEKNFIIFEGDYEEGSISYKECEYFDNPSRPEEKIDFYDIIRSGDRLSLKGEQIIISKEGKEIFRKDKRDNWFLIDFD